MSDSSIGAEDLIEGDPPEASAQSDDQAASSPQEDQGGELIDAVQDALKSSEKEESPVSSAESDGKSALSKSVEDPLSEITDEELKRYGPKTQRRIRQLLDTRSELNGHVDALRPKAESFDKIDEYIRTSGITNEDFSVLLELGALVRNDPFKAFERLSAITAELAKVTGHELPPDVAERVKLGYISEQDARELVQNRRRASLAEQRSAQQTEQVRGEQERQRLDTHVQTCRQTANDWEARRKSSDPDWDWKQQKIAEKLELELRRSGYPDTQDKVVQMLDGFLTDVNAELNRFRPKPREVRPTIGSASSRANSASMPATFKEYVDQLLAH